MWRFFTQVLSIVVLAIAITGCPLSVDKGQLPEGPALVLDGFETAVSQQIQLAYGQWEAAPRTSQTNGALAMLLHTYLQYPTASVYYQRARLLAPDEFRWAYLHALVLLNLGERDDAIEALRRAVVLDPQYLPAAIRLAETLADAGQNDESREAYETLLESDPNLPQALFGLSQLVPDESSDKRIELLVAAVNRRGPYGAAHYALAEAYRQRGDLEKTDRQLAFFETFRTRVPEVTDTLVEEMQNLNSSKQGLINRGQRNIAQGRVSRAIDDLERALARDASNANTHSLLITAHGMMGNIEQAESHFRQGIALDPELVQLHNNLGTLRLRQRRYDEAARAFRDAVGIDPDYTDAYVNLGAALELSGKRSEAIRQYKKAIEGDPLNRTAGFHLGNAYLNMGNHRQAIEQFSRILEPEDGRTPEYLRSLAVAYTGTRNIEAAEAALQRAVTIAGNTGRDDLLPNLRAGLQALQQARGRR